MIYGENQVRQFYVVKDVKSAGTPITMEPGRSVPVKNDGAKKFYVKYVDPQGNLITTDKVDLNSIRDIRITYPKGYDVRKWTIEMDTTLVNNITNTVGENYMLYFDFENINGFGRNDRYQKFVVLHANSQNTASVSDFYAAFTEQIEKLIKHDKLFGSVFESVTNTGSAIELVEAEPKISNKDLLLGYYANKVDVVITAGPVTDNNFIEYDPWVRTEDANNDPIYNVHSNDGVKYGGIEPTIDHTTHNRYVIFEMENFFSRGRADLYGLNGCAFTANPSEMMTSQFTEDTDFVILDMKYYFQEMGMLNQNSEKEMSFAIPVDDATKLLRLVDTIADDNVDLSTDLELRTTGGTNKSVTLNLL